MAEERSSGSGKKLTRCERHGIYYDDADGAMCPRCFEDAERSSRSGPAFPEGPRSPSRQARFPLLPLVVLLAVGGGFGYWWMTRPERPAPKPLFGLPGAASGMSLRPLDPAPFRSEISALESILYDPAPPNLLTPGRVGEAARTLGQIVMRKGPKVIAQQAGARILGFANEIGTIEEVGYSLADLGRARDQWESIRNDVFRNASWFSRSTPELAAAQTPPKPRADPRLLRQLTDWSLEIERTLRFARTEVNRYGEIGVDVAERSREARKLYDGWIAFARRWDRRMASVKRMAPAQPAPGSDASASMAYQYLARAARQLEMLPQTANDYGVPFRNERKMKLDAARSELANGRRELARARR